MKISVIVCTHNPREDFLRRTLESLRGQTLPQDQWELLLIDNASSISIAGRCDISWQPHARHLLESKLGKLNAWLLGMYEARGDVLVFVDDDNVLASDYLEQALMIGEQWPILGAWGGGISPEFEIDPPSWCLDQPWRLTILDVKEDIWSNVREGFETKPAGAGMCIRKKVGERYIEWCRVNKISTTLDRTGKGLGGYGDMDLAHCAIDVGLGTGLFTRLHLTHLIPASRLTLDYLLRHAEGDAASFMMFRAIRGLPVERPEFSFMAEVRWRIHRLRSRKPAELIKIQEADRKGRKTGWKLIQQHLNPSKPSKAK